jgi:hypothetical protein
MLGAILAAVFVIAYNTGHDVSGSEIKPHGLGLLMIGGAAAGLILFGIFSGPTPGYHDDFSDEPVAHPEGTDKPGPPD